MKISTFIGHRDSPEEIKALIKHAIIEAIEKENIYALSYFILKLSRFF